MIYYYMKLISIVVAVSLDGFGVGMTYGMRKIRISISSLFVIMFCSGGIVVTSMTIGHLLRAFISPSFTNIAGSLILIFLGLFILHSMIRMKKNEQKSAFKDSNEKTFGHFKSVLSSPQNADKDRSGTISLGEAFVLGSALALDAFGAGLGASMLGYSPLITSISIAVMSGVFVFTGMRIGYILANLKYMEKLTFLPPIILICIGVYHLF